MSHSEEHDANRAEALKESDLQPHLRIICQTDDMSNKYLSFYITHLTTLITSGSLGPIHKDHVQDA